MAGRVDGGDRQLGEQWAIDAYYRVQLTPRVAISPTLQFVIDPVRNPTEDEIVVLGLRTRFEF